MPAPFPRKLHAGWFAGFLLATLGLVACRSDRTAPADSAAAPDWLWRNHDLRHVEATGFFLVREFQLEVRPDQALIHVVGDEEYILSLNGHRIGSGAWRLGQPVDEYDVSPYLVLGRNRILAELRGTTGSGGFWLELLGDRRTILRSDRDWEWFRGAPRSLFGESEIPHGKPPMVLGPSPMGRWGELSSFVRRPNFEQVLAELEPVPAAAWRRWGSSGEWQPFDSRPRRPPSLGPLVEIDFGEVRFGYLQLTYRESDGFQDRTALVRFGIAPAESPPVTADLVFRPIPGRNLFQDSKPRHFRYAAIAALPGLFAAELLSIREDADAGLNAAAEAAPVRGLLGVKPPRLRSPVEDEIWRELERLPDLGVRKNR